MPRLGTLKVLWGAILASSLVLFCLMLVLAPGGGEPSVMLAVVLGAVALANALASLVLPVALYRVALRRLDIPTRETEDAGPVGGMAGRTATDPRGALQALLSAYTPPFIIGMSLSEAVGLCGFVLGFLGHSIETVMPFFVTTWALMATRYPALERVLGPAEALTGVHVPLGGA